MKLFRYIVPIFFLLLSIVGTAQSVQKQDASSNDTVFCRIADYNNSCFSFGYVLSNGEVIKPKYDYVGYFSDNNFAAIRLGRKYGFINKSGNVVVEPKYDYFSNFSEGLARVKLNDKWGYIDTIGNIVVDFIYDGAYDFSNGLARVKQDVKWGLIDTTGMCVIEPKFFYVNDFFNDVACVEEVVGLGNSAKYKDKKGRFHVDELLWSEFEDKYIRYGYIDRAGNYIVKPKYCSASDFEYDIACVCLRNGKCGFIDKKGNVVVELKYDIISNFHDGMAIIRLNNKEGFIDTTGKNVIEPRYCDVYPFYNGFAQVVTADENLYYKKLLYINKKGDVVFSERYSGREQDVSIDGFLQVYNDRGFGVMDTTGKIIVPTEYDYINYNPHQSMFSHGLLRVSKKYQYGYVDKTGRVVVPLQFKEARRFSENGLAQVKLNDKWGIIDTAGNFVVQPQCDEISIWGDFICVKMNEKWGIVNRTGNFIIEPQLEDEVRFLGKYACIKTKGKWYLIDGKGNSVLGPFSRPPASAYEKDDGYEEWFVIDCSDIIYEE